MTEHSSRWMLGGLAALFIVACGSSKGATQDAVMAGGGSSNTAGSSSVGGATAGTSAGGDSSSAAGAMASAGAGPFVPPKCSGTSDLPATAPALKDGVWTNISPQVKFTPSFTQGMTMDPCNPATLYVSVVSFDASTIPQNGLYRSTDAGTSWSRIGKLDFVINVRVDPGDPKHLYAADGVNGTTYGFWVSKDGGDTWTSPPSFVKLSDTLISDSYHVDPDPADFNHVLVTFHNPWRGAEYNGNSGIIETKDGGDTWVIHPPVNTKWAGGYDAFFLYNPKLGIGDPNTWLFGTQGDGYWRTSDAGKTWKQVSLVNMDHGGGKIYYTASGTLYVSGAPNVLRSTDNGVTWTEIVPAQFTAFLSIIGDGKQLYAAGHGAGRFYTALESMDTVWNAVGGDPDVFTDAGPFELNYDSANRILYSAGTGAGVWARKIPAGQ